ncbi:hypothetical protein [Streptomyces venezuelae]|uniref:hypothetical protein n=1 Tax=Streptomyces venezuelae TaxID=54571 RepID=UPI003792FD97
MNVDARGPRRGKEHERADAVLHVLLRMGPGPHKCRDIAARTPLDTRQTQRALRHLYDARLCDRPRHGYWQIRPTSAALTGATGLVHPVPTTTPLLDIALLLEHLHHHTQQAVLLHTHSPLTSERLCIAAAGTNNPTLSRDLAHTPHAADRMRQAPLDSDAPGLTILANLTGHKAPLRADLHQIRAAQTALTLSPLPGWTLVSVPLHRLPGAETPVAAAVSILTPDHAPGAPLVTYGKLLRNAIRNALEPETTTTPPTPTLSTNTNTSTGTSTSTHQHRRCRREATRAVRPRPGHALAARGHA